MTRKVGLAVLTAILVSSVFAASGTAVSTQPVEVWNVTWGGSGGYEGLVVATAGDYVYLAGDIDDFYAFLNKYDRDGNLLWNITWAMFPSCGDCSSNLVAMTATVDSIYMAGMTASSNNSDSDAFLNRYDTDGNLLWNITYGGPADDMGYATAATDDSVYLAGGIISNGSDYAALLNRYDTDGNLLWNITWSGPGCYAASDVAASGDCVYVAGWGGHKSFLNKYDTDGILIWNTTSLGMEVRGIAAGDHVVYSAENSFSNAFLTKYNSTDGSLVWNITGGSPLNITSGRMSCGLATAATGDSVYLSGINGSLDLDFSNAFLTKYNSTDGSLIWNTTWGKAGWVSGRAVAATNDCVYLAGTTANSSDSNGSAFLVKYSEPTPTPTPTVTLTQSASPEHSPTTAPAVPGFEAISTILGLLAVAYLAMARRK
jgi:hypothetical protein